MPIATGQDILAADVLAMRPFVELAGGESQAPTQDAWTDWDISAIVPALTKSVLVLARTSGTNANPTMGVRKNGSALSRTFAMSYTGTFVFTILTECDANRIIEIWGNADAVTNSRYNIVGYWT